MTKTDLERKCNNCNSFFLEIGNHEADYGICLNDEVFESHIDDLLSGNCSGCKELVKQKKFSGEKEVCDNYDEIDFDGIEIPEDVMFDKDGKIDIERISQIIAIESIGDHWANAPVEDHAAKLLNPKTFDSAFNTLIGYGSHGNEAARKVISEYFGSLPSPLTLEQVHHKIAVFERLFHAGISRDEIVDLAVEEMKELSSNNTTRPLYTVFLNYLSRLPPEAVKAPLQKLLSERKFSTRLQKRLMDICDPQEENVYW